MSAIILPAEEKDSASLSPSVQKVYVRQITLSHYRNYSGLKQAFSAGRVILTGLNGAGKTNLLELLLKFLKGTMKRIPFSPGLELSGTSHLRNELRVFGAT